MFFSYAVENSCWITAMLRGQDRSEEAEMRPKEFTVLLDEILSKKSSKSKPHSAVGSRQAGVGDGFPESFRESGRSRQIYQLGSQKRRRTMRRTNPDPRPYFLIPVKASTEASSRRWNQVLIVMLGMLVVGLLLVAFVPQAGSSSSVVSKVPLN
jgi:hypothetical protein